MLDWSRLWLEAIRLNLVKARYRRRRARSLHTLGTRPLADAGPAPCQAASDSGRAGRTRCEACLLLDKPARLRWLCPALDIQSGEARCTLDSAEVGPRWGRAALILLAPLVALHLAGASAYWAALRNQGLDTLAWTDVAAPHRWSQIREHRRQYFRALALRSLATGDLGTATVALFNAAQEGDGPPEDNLALARLATLGGYHSLADQLHAANIARHPDRAEALAVAWHDELLVGDRPLRLALLAVEQLSKPDADREFWLRAFFASIRHPDVAASLLDTPGLAIPHPGLRHALQASRALQITDQAEARDHLLALEAMPPGAAALHHIARLRAEARFPDPTPAATPAHYPALHYNLRQRQGRPEEARNLLRPLLADPDSPRFLTALGALVLDPDPVLVSETARLVGHAIPISPAGSRRLAALWLAARRAGLTPLDLELARHMADSGLPIPTELAATDFTGRSRAPLGLAVALLPLDREILLAARDYSPGQWYP